MKGLWLGVLEASQMRVNGGILVKGGYGYRESFQRLICWSCHPWYDECFRILEGELLFGHTKEHILDFGSPNYCFKFATRVKLAFAQFLDGVGSDDGYFLMTSISSAGGVWLIWAGIPLPAILIEVEHHPSWHGNGKNHLGDTAIFHWSMVHPQKLT